MNSWKKISEKIKTAPKTPGVYIFYGPGSENATARQRRAKNSKKVAFLLPGKKPLYIGKASNLKNRLQSYLKGADGKSERLRENATHLKLIPLRSEIEALIEEAKLIKTLHPPYNVLWRDDKSYFYAAISEEKFPRIFVTHKNLLPTTYHLPLANSIGPFTEGRALKLVLRMLRRNFPYCTCPKPHLRLCLNAQIGNCGGFCCRKGSSSTQKQITAYRKNIIIVKNFLIGKPIKKFAKNLKPGEQEALEKILAHRDFLETLSDADHTQTYAENSPRDSAPALPSTSPEGPLRPSNGSRVEGSSQRESAIRIEGYDISHLSGKETVAGMTAWEFSAASGNETALRPRKEFWRKFIIRSAKPSDDPAAIKETLARRLNHPEWPYPDMMIIDGGLAQFNAAKEIVGQFEAAKKIRVLSLGKPGRLVYGLEKNPKELGEAPPELQKIIPTVITETHNFAIRFHRVRRNKNFLSPS
ncbi:MAG: GIY-YIG nuclease family protein [Candidatus Liptonbacteria bacterium]|nr:GIY-YIG nuclease family protein [Candidatus Liptonbacteria bacterium]